MKKRRLTPLGVIIKQRLAELGKTQLELAKEIGTTDRYLHLIMYGHRSGKKYLGKIMEVLEIDPKQIKKTA